MPCLKEREKEGGWGGGGGVGLFGGRWKLAIANFEDHDLHATAVIH